MAPSFSHRLKTELCAAECDDVHAMLYGMLLLARSGPQWIISSDNRRVTEFFASLLRGFYGVSAQVSPRGHGAATVYDAQILPEDRHALLQAFGSSLGSTRFIDSENFTADGWLPAFFRGCFFACGTVSDPNKSYRLELAVPDDALCKQLSDLLAQALTPPKRTVRREQRILYYRDSEPVEEFLTLIGGTRAVLELMEIKVLKDVRNHINRRTNCETANLGKTVAAAVRQAEDIRLIRQKRGLDSLPEDLRELADLRLAHPELSLSELGGMLSEPLSRSGVNHRLNRIRAIADLLR